MNQAYNDEEGPRDYGEFLYRDSSDTNVSNSNHYIDVHEDPIYTIRSSSVNSLPSFVIEPSESTPTEEHNKKSSSMSPTSSRASSTTNLNMYSPVFNFSANGANNLFMRKRPSVHQRTSSNERNTHLLERNALERDALERSALDRNAHSHERKLSTHDGKYDKDAIITSPKTPIRSITATPMQSFQAQQRNPLSPMKSYTGVPELPELSNSTASSSVNLNGKAFIVPTNTVDSKRLVDQFYNSINEATASLASSMADVSHLLKSLANVSYNNGSEKSTPQLEKSRFDFDFDDEDEVVIGSGKPLTDEEFGAIVDSGGFDFTVNTRASEDDELTSYLLNIDCITEEMGKNGGHFKNRMFVGSSLPTTANTNGRVEGVGSIQMLSQIIEALGNNLRFRDELVKSGTPKGHRSLHTLQLTTSVEETASLVDLNLLSKYLCTMHESTKTLQDELLRNRDAIRVKYRSEISDNVTRLNELLGDLNLLELRLNRVKTRINDDKSIMSLEMIEKLELLEFINKKFQEHAKKVKDTRFKQLNIILAILVIVLSLYFGLR